MPHRRAVPLAAALLLVMSAGYAAAADETRTVHCDYAWPADPDCRIEFPDSGGDPDHPMADVVLGGEWHGVAQLSVVDDLWGPGVVIGGFICNDGNDNGICGETEKGEVAEEFCGGDAGSPGGLATSTKDWDGDGHADYGARLVITVYGPVRQTLSCGTGGPTMVPGATTGGILDPAGGLFATLFGGPGPAGEAGG